MSTENESPTQIFANNTVEHTFTKNQRDYIMRYCNGEICCDTPWDRDEDTDWPVANFVIPLAEETEPRDSKILGAIWTKIDAQDKDFSTLIAFWAAEVGDGHVEFYCSSQHDFAQTDLADISEKLCDEICEEMADVLDDGSGIEREPNAIPDLEKSVPAWLADYYSSSWCDSKISYHHHEPRDD